MLAKDQLGLLSIILAVAGYIPYLYTIWKRHTKPHLFSWAIWGLVNGIIYFAQDSDLAGPGSWAAATTTLFTIIISIATFRYSEKNITRGDWLMFLTTLAALPLWHYTKSPRDSVILLTMIDNMAWYPTFRKSYVKPHSENIFLYLFGMMKLGLSLLAMEHYTLVTALAPGAGIFVEGAFVIMIFWRRYALKRRRH